MTSGAISAGALTADYVNHVLAAVKAVFETALGCTPTRTGVALKEVLDHRHQISAVVGISGRTTGTIVLRFEKSTALEILDRLMGVRHTELTSEACDAIGELTSMIAGAARSDHEYFGASSVPSIVIGANHEVRFPTEIQPICIDFESDIGPFAIEAGVATNE